MTSNRTQLKANTNEVDVKDQLLPPDTINLNEIQEDTKSDDTAFLPWWTGVREISIYMNEENAKEIEKEIPARFNVMYFRVFILILAQIIK